MINAILKLAIYRRFIMLSLGLVVIAAGLWSYPQLPIDAVPDITNVQVQINTAAPGYSPLETEQRITFPIETALAGLPHLSYTRSLSRYGLSQVTVVFEEGTDLYFARTRIDERLAALENTLPDGIEIKMGPIATGLGEIYSYAVVADEGARQTNGQPYDAMALREIQDWIIKPQLAMVNGVVEINTIGGYDKQFQVQPDPLKMLELGITQQELEQALARNNQNRGAGYIETNGQQLLARSPGQLHGLSDIASVVIAYRNAVPIRIQDVANVVIGKELRTGAATLDGSESVIGTAMMLIGKNSLQVAEQVAERLEQIAASLPEGVSVKPVYDRTTLVNKAIATVRNNLQEGALLVIVVLFLLLGNLRAALITAAIIPLTMLATITGMVQLGISANLMSLGALDFGLIVDGTVIIVENAIRRLAMAGDNSAELGFRERLHLVFEATNEVIRPSLFGVAIITGVYIPIFSLTGVEGKMFHPMAATVILALLCAIVFSMTLVPASVALFLRGRIQERENALMRIAKAIYRPILELALKIRYLLILVTAIWVGFAAWLAGSLGSEFIPQLDEGDIALHAMRTPGTGLQQALDMQQVLEQRIMEFAEVALVFAKLGTAEVATDPMPPNIADTFIMLKPQAEWPDPGKTREQLVSEIERAVRQLPGNNYEFTQPIQMRFNELISGVRADLGIKLFGDDLSQLRRSAGEILEVVQSVDGAADARLEQIDALPMLSISPKRFELARYGMDVEALQDAIAMGIGGKTIGLIYQGDRRFELVIRLPDSIRQRVDELGNLPIPLKNGQFVPLGEVADIAITPAPNQISRENGKRRVVISANVRGRDLGSFVEEVQARVAEEVELPSGYWLRYGGTFEQLESASQRLMIVVPITLLLTLGLLVMAFNSIRDALIIFSGVPLALTGGVLALWLRAMPFSISAGIGFIALSGIAVLNGLVLIAFIREHYEQQQDLRKAVMEGALTRLRPVLMTALVASLGFVPMAFNTGTGAEVQKPLATVVIGGITSSTLLTLIVLPALYYTLQPGRVIRASRKK